MRRVAVISDIHSNIPALEAVLADIDDVGVDEIWCMGDVVGYGADSPACVEIVLERCSVTLAGNHDLAVLGTISSENFGKTAKAGVAHSAGQMAKYPHLLDAMRAWVPQRGLDRAGVPYDGAGIPDGAIVLAHGCPEPFDPVRDYVAEDVHPWRILDALPAAKLVLTGHVHLPLVCYGDTLEDEKFEFIKGNATRAIADHQRAVVNTGSVGQPRDDDVRAGYALVTIDPGAGPSGLEWRRVEYDIELAIAHIAATDLPRMNGERLRIGE